MKSYPILLVAAFLLWTCSVKAQSALVARISERKQVETADLRGLAWLEADKSYWVMGCTEKGEYVVMHESGSAVILPNNARFRVIEGGRWAESPTIQLSKEKVKSSTEDGIASYSALFDIVPKNGFVAVQIYADNEPCGAAVQRITNNYVDISINFKSVADAKITYSAHYFVNGNELHQAKPSSGW